MTLRDEGQAKLEAAVASKMIRINENSFSEVRSSLKEKYGERGWIGEFVKREKGLTPSDGRAYQSARKQVERWNSYDKTGKYNPARASAAGKEAIAKVGRTIPPDVPKNGINITIQGKQGSGRHERERTFTHHFEYQEALQFANSPDLGFLMKEIYPDWGDDAADTLFPDSDDDDSGSMYDVSIA